jgi:anaerobic magnesium-protoporphyrin IX monomethyl ester cyclase
MKNKNFKILFLYPNEPLLGITPSNLALLSAYLKNDGFEVKLFDCTLYKPKDKEDEIAKRVKLGQVVKTDYDNYIHPLETDMYEDFVKLVNDYKPNVVAVSIIDSTVHMAVPFLEKIQQQIKERNIAVVGGGCACAFIYERVFKTNMFEYLCIGEGELAFLELCNKLYNEEDCTNIQNIYVKKNGRIIKNSLRPLINLDELLPPDFSIYEDWRFYRPYREKVVRMTQIDVGRGCPANCTFCLSPSLKNKYREEKCGQYYRLKSIDKMISDIKDTVDKYNINFLWISSETFLAINVEKLKKLAKKYKEQINLPFWTASRLDTFTEEKTKLLVEMGCEGMGIGFEHGDEEMRNNILKKHVTDKQTFDGFKMIAKYHIFPTVNSMIGLPGETREHVFKTVKMNKEISKILDGYHNINVFTFIPFSGTALRDLCIERGYLAEDDEYSPCSLFAESTLNMPPPYLSREEIGGLQKTIGLYIKLPESYWSDIKIAEKDDEEGNKMFEKLLKLIQK